MGVDSGFIYTWRPSASTTMTTPTTKSIEFVVDATDPDSPNFSKVGEIFYDPNALHLDQEYVDKEFTTDQWGEWLSASAPIRDKDGKAVAALGVDLAASQIKAEWFPLLAAAVVSCVMSGIVILTLVIGVWCFQD